MHSHRIPIIDILPLDEEVHGSTTEGWNAGDLVLTELFNALICCDRYIVDFCIEVAQRALEQEQEFALPMKVQQQLYAFVDQASLIRRRYEDHMQWLLAHGYEEFIPVKQTKAFRKMLTAWSLPDLVAVAAAHKCLSHGLCDYTLSNFWLLSQAQGRPALLCKWQAVMELLHRSAFVDLANAMSLPVKKRKWGFEQAERHSVSMFYLQYKRTLGKQGALRFVRILGTFYGLYKVFWSPKAVEAQIRRSKRYYVKAEDCDSKGRHKQLIDDWLVNNKANFVQLNPNVTDSNYNHSMFTVRDSAM